MNNKEELKKQVIVLSIILVLVIIVAVFLNTRNNKGTIIKNTKNPKIETTQNEINSEQKIMDNLKGLLEEPEDEEEQVRKELQNKKENVIVTQNGEQIIIME